MYIINAMYSRAASISLLGLVLWVVECPRKVAALINDCPFVVHSNAAHKTLNGSVSATTQSVLPNIRESNPEHSNTLEVTLGRTIVGG